MSQIIQNPTKIYDDIKKQILQGVKDRNHGFHLPIFTNLNNDQRISSKIVVLRNFDPVYMSLNFNTDIRSKKINEIKENSETFFLFYDSKIKIQLRVSTNSKIHYNDSFSKKAWQDTKLSSRKCYLTNNPPSSKSEKPADGLPDHLFGIDPSFEESENGFNNFAVIINKINSIDWLHLSSTGHRRLLITLKNKSNKYEWLIP